jgi:hypothetical protein
MTDLIKPGTIWDDIEEYIQMNDLKDKWVLTENEDDADDIMDDEEEETRAKHIRLTIQGD